MKKIKCETTLFMIYFLYILVILGTEVFDGICYLLEWSQNTAISRIIIVALLVGLLLCIRNRIEFKKNTITKMQWLCMLTILILGIMKSVYPDTACDTTNYHLMVQKPGFVNYFTEHFAKGNFQVWGFRLGDRLFWSFRKILGYRFGTLLNTFVLVLLYLQIRRLLDLLIPDDSAEGIILKNIYRNKDIWALLIIGAYHIVMMLGIYYVDILYIPIAIEAVVLLLRSSYDEPSEMEVYYFALLNGMWFAFKMTNIVFLVPCILLYISINRKFVNVRRLMISAILVAFPCMVYLVYNYVSVGNPVFPYFNTIFESPYFQLTDFKDSRWGGENFFEKLIWVFSMVLRPDYRVSEIPDWNMFLYLLGLLEIICSMGVLIMRFCKKIYMINPKDILAIFTLIASVLWGITTGYCRYFMFGYILLGIFAYMFIIRVAKFSKELFLTTMLFFGALLTVEHNVLNVVNGLEWSWKKWTPESFVQQAQKVLTDRDVDCVDVDMFYLTDSVYGGIAELMNSNTFTYVAGYKQNMADESIMENALAEKKAYGMVRYVISKIIVWMN